jgi:16S rRNA (guanine527-N7)-methyltransferase
MTREELSAAGGTVNEAAYARLAHFVQVLLAENRKLNLTAAGDEAEVWRGHVCDSLALLPAVREHNVQRLVDIGSGGGLPGLPLACVCEGLDVTLVDATRKKVAALERIITQLDLAHAQAVWGRAETLAHEAAYREQFDAATARAVATLPVLIEYAAGFVRPGGHCWFFKSAAGLHEEAGPAESAARACRLTPAGSICYTLPGERDERVLVYYRKDGELSAELPRRAGRAAKRPL